MSVCDASESSIESSNRAMICCRYLAFAAAGRSRCRAISDVMLFLRVTGCPYRASVGVGGDGEAARHRQLARLDQRAQTDCLATDLRRALFECTRRAQVRIACSHLVVRIGFAAEYLWGSGPGPGADRTGGVAGERADVVRPLALLEVAVPDAVAVSSSGSGR